MKYTFYEILEGPDKGKIVRNSRESSEILTESGWESYNAMDILFDAIDSRILTEEEVKNVVG